MQIVFRNGQLLGVVGNVTIDLQSVCTVKAAMNNTTPVEILADIIEANPEIARNCLCVEDEFVNFDQLTSKHLCQLSDKIKRKFDKFLALNDEGKLEHVYFAFLEGELHFNPDGPIVHRYARMPKLHDGNSYEGIYYKIKSITVMGDGRNADNSIMRQIGVVGMGKDIILQSLKPLIGCDVYVSKHELVSFSHSGADFMLIPLDGKGFLPNGRSVARFMLDQLK